MPISCRYFLYRKLAIIVHTGSIADDEFFSFYLAFRNDPRFAMISTLLVDLRSSDSTAIRSETLEKLAHEMKTHSIREPALPKTAIVAQSDIAFGLSRVYEAYRESDKQNFSIFRKMDDALTWLALPDNLLEEIGQAVTREVALSGGMNAFPTRY